MPKILYLLDGHALAYRSYFALTSGGTARWATSTGEPTAGVFGFASTLLRILEQDQPDYLAVSFDTGRTFRHDLYTEYKGTRAKMPEDLRGQVERIREMVDAFNIPRLELENYEADDVIGSLAVWAAREEGLGVKIITGDRDLLQLVTNRVVVSLPNSKTNTSEDYFPEDVQRKLGVLPEQVVDYKALVGDPSDNIPGVKGIGEKTAVSLLAKYGTLDSIYEHLSEISGRAGAALEAGKQDAYLSQNLARIRTDLKLRFDLTHAEADRFNPAAVEDLFRQLEFRTLTQRLHALVRKIRPSLDGATQQSLFAEDSTPALELVSSGDWTTVLVDSEEELRTCIAELSRAKQIAFDTETTGTDPMQAELVGISLAAEPSRAFYIPLGHKQGKQLSRDRVFQALQPLLENPKISKVGHNSKYDLICLEQAGYQVSPIAFDTMIAEWLINPDSRNMGLKNLAWVRLGAEMTRIEELIGTGKNQKSMAEVPIEKAAPYAAADAVMTLRLVEPLSADLTTHQAEGLNRDLEVKLIPVLADMEQKGILLDTAMFTDFARELNDQIRRIEDSIYTRVGENFNINSTQQLSDMLFKRLGLESPDRSRKTSAGKLSTAAGVLEEMRGQHPVIDEILQYRELTKLKSTYVDALPLQVNPKTGRIHTSFNQTGTVTGRVASQNPNLQNIPTRTDLGRRVRQGFIAAPGTRLLSIDYSQIELRIMAHISQDEAMLEAFRQGQDIHAATAAAIYNIPLEKVEKNQRRHAKAINFGLIYGMSAFGLTRATDLTLAEAENYIKAYFDHFPKVKTWLDNTRVLAAKQGYVETLLGRRRYFPNLQTGTNYAMRQREEREAINAPIQGTAADIIKLAMIALPDAFEQARLNGCMLLQVHDELIFEVPEREVAETIATAKGVMEHTMPLDVPLLTEARTGSNWGELEPVSDSVIEDLTDV
ncbi:MAG TPA: DNA polymerase I [Anaerolineaceae bacterium]|nr:DNA polymerase I [Anaerolineaceae bacterium]